MGWLPAPEPDMWAIAAGLPEPLDEEDFCAYVTRLGVDCEQMVRELTPQTACLANVRLNSYLIITMRDEFRAHVHARALAYSTPARLKENERFAELYTL